MSMLSLRSHFLFSFTIERIIITARRDSLLFVCPHVSITSIKCLK